MGPRRNIPESEMKFLELQSEITKTLQSKRKEVEGTIEAYRLGIGSIRVAEALEGFVALDLNADGNWSVKTGMDYVLLEKPPLRELLGVYAAMIDPQSGFVGRETTRKEVNDYVSANKGNLLQRLTQALGNTMAGLQKREEASEQNLLLGLTMEDLQNPHANAVDLENALYNLSKLGGLSPDESMQVLRIAGSRAANWTRFIGAEQVIQGIQPSLARYKRSAEQQKTPEARTQLLEATTQVLSGVITTAPDSYQEVIAPELKKGTFGEPGVILSAILRKLSQTFKEKQSLGADRETTCEAVATMVDDLIKSGDRKSLDEAKPDLPVGLMLAEDEVTMQFPDVYKIVKELGFDTKGVAKTVVEAFASLEDPDDYEELMDRVLAGEFGNSAEALSGGIIYLYSDEPIKAGIDEDTRDIIAEYLWVELLDLKQADRYDKKLKPVRETVSNQGWYWYADGDDVVYTAVDTLEGMGIRPGQERSFIESHTNLILDALVGNNQQPDVRAAVERIDKNKEKLGTKLANILGEIRSDSDRDLFRKFPDSLLIACLDPITS